MGAEVIERVKGRKRGRTGGDGLLLGRDGVGNGQRADGGNEAVKVGDPGDGAGAGEGIRGGAPLVTVTQPPERDASNVEDEMRDLPRVSFFGQFADCLVPDCVGLSI